MYKQQETRDILIERLREKLGNTLADSETVDALVELVDFLIEVKAEDLVHQINRTGQWDPDY